jgi:CBS domain containing-hemolysin-like protein
VTVALGLGALASHLFAVALTFAAAKAYTDTATTGFALPILLASCLGLLPLAITHFIVPNLKTAEDIDARWIWLVAPFVFAWSVFLLPVSTPLDKILTHMAHQPENREAREEALMALVENDEVDGVLETEKRDMISSIMNIDEKGVREVMVPRVDMVAIDRHQSLDDLLALVRTTQHSRIPVFDGKLDNIVGIVHAKDVLEAFGQAESGDRSGMTADTAMRESQVLFVPMTKKVDDLLREFRKAKKHMAIVVDEYGGTAGLVTMEDLLEEIVGEIQDEYDEEELPFRWLDAGILEVDATMNIADLNEILDADLPVEQGYETAAGFMYHQFGAVPSKGDETSYGRFHFQVEAVDAQRITKIRVHRPDPEDEKAGAGSENDHA